MTQRANTRDHLLSQGLSRDEVALVARLHKAGIPMVAVGPNDKPRESWKNAHSPADLHLTEFREGDGLLMLCGHGLDVVDLDTKVAGNTIGNVPPFDFFGITRTPSGGAHYVVRSTGIGKMSLPGVGDYCGGTFDYQSRLGVYLPGSRRTKYPDGGYVIERPWNIDACLRARPDPDLVEYLRSVKPADQHGDVEWTGEPATEAEKSEAEAVLGRMAASLAKLEPGEGREPRLYRNLSLLYRFVAGGSLEQDQVDEVMLAAVEAQPESGASHDDTYSRVSVNAAKWAEREGPVHPDVSDTEGTPASVFLDGPARAAAEAKEKREQEMAAARARQTTITGLASLLSDVEKFLRRFIVFSEDAAYAVVALWVAHTYVVHSFDSSPRLAVLSPDPSSGKSRVLEVLDVLCANPMHAMSTTQAALFRSIPRDPTILFDEIDTIFGPKAREHEDLRGLLNSGHRNGAVATRCEFRGKEVIVAEWPTYAPVAMAGLGWLPDTLMARSIVLWMQRRLPSEVIEPFRRRVQEPESQPLRDGLALWAAEPGTRKALEGAWPEFPEGIQDRDADVWEALLILADLAGEDWPDLVREAALGFVQRRKAGGADSLGIALLRDLRRLFNRSGADRLSSMALVDGLINMHASPWQHSGGRDKPLDQGDLARRLKAYGIGPTTVRQSVGLTGEPTEVIAKGYKREDFTDAWARYVGDEDESPFEEVDPDGA